MYDAYRTICNKYFPNTMHIVNHFHVIQLLTRAINKLRVNVMNKQSKSSAEYKFMKTHWKLFLCRKDRIPDKWYKAKNEDSIHYSDMVFRCIQLDKDLLEASNILYDLLAKKEFGGFYETLDWIDYFIDRLRSSDNEILNTVGNSYHKWRVEIANGLYKKHSGINFSNGVAEATNNKIKTIIKVSYGYQNFEIFRKRVMMIITYEKSDTHK